MPSKALQHVWTWLGSKDRISLALSSGHWMEWFRQWECAEAVKEMSQDTWLREDEADALALIWNEETQERQDLWESAVSGWAMIDSLNMDDSD